MPTLLERWASCLAALAALAGAAGVGEAAYAAHGTADPLFQTSSQFLILHAAAVIAIAGFGLLRSSRAMLMAASLLMLGLLLFCGDLSYRAALGARLFPMAAPTGGSLMILGWFATALGALFTLRRAG